MADVVYDNRWLKSDLRRLRLDKIGFIFQFHNLLPFLNTTENVAMVLELAGATTAEAKRRAVELLDYLGVGNRKNAMPATVSGGEASAWPLPAPWPTVPVSFWPTNPRRHSIRSAPAW